MISKLNLENILFLDIETVPEVPYFSDLDETKQALWEHKSQYQRKDDETAEAFYERAGIWAEFGKIICISVGYFTFRGDIRNFRVTSFYGDEIKILKDFKNLLISHFSETKHLLCAHNGKEFDFPYIARRMIINNIELPYKLNLFGKKPWEVPHLDTLELWKFGDYKTYTSLKLLAAALGISSPKDDIDGSQVGEVYWKENDLQRIVTYCQKDIITTANILLRFKNMPLIEHNNVVFVK